MWPQALLQGHVGAGLSGGGGGSWFPAKAELYLGAAEARGDAWLLWLQGAVLAGQCPCKQNVSAD